MKRMLAMLFGITLLFAGFAVASASADPGPDTGNSEKGLCTAYFNGQKKGHDKNGSPGPFAALEDRADPDGEAEGSEELAAMVWDHCEGFGIGGNPEHGRWTCEEVEDETECTRNDPPGNSGGNGG